MEALTDEIEQKANELILKIDKMGGAVNAVEKGFIQEEIARSSYQYQKDIESQEKIIVGVNDYKIEGEKTEPVFKIDESIRQVQTEKLKKLRNERDSVLVQQNIVDIQSCAKEDRNIMPSVLAAVESKATLGEIADSLREVYGEYNG